MGDECRRLQSLQVPATFIAEQNHSKTAVQLSQFTQYSAGGGFGGVRHQIKHQIPAQSDECVSFGQPWDSRCVCCCCRCCGIAHSSAGHHTQASHSKTTTTTTGKTKKHSHCTHVVIKRHQQTNQQIL